MEGEKRRGKKRGEERRGERRRGERTEYIFSSMDHGSYSLLIIALVYYLVFLSTGLGRGENFVSYDQHCLLGNLDKGNAFLILLLNATIKWAH